MVSTQEAAQIIGAAVYDPSGTKVGKVGQVFVDVATGQPEWLTVKTGLFGTKESFVPLAKAQVRPDHDVQLEVDKDTVTHAPTVEPEGGRISLEEEARIYRHYGLPYSEDVSDTGLPDADQTPADRAPAGDGRDRRPADAGTDAGPTTEGRSDDAMTRSEEVLHVDTTSEPVGRARLRKYVTSEQVEDTVQVRREEARIEREPITDANRDAALSGPDISEAEHEVTLHAEKPVVRKEAVPVERVRLTTEDVADEAKVSEEVRKERIETDGDITEHPDR